MMMAADSIPDQMHISLKGKSAVYKSELMMLEMLARANWERPLYIALTVGSSNYGNLGENFVQEGLANRITPFNTAKSGRRIDTERMYDNLMNKFRFGGIDNPNIYLDETVMRMCYTHRRLFSQLVNQLLAEGQNDKALLALEKVDKCIPAVTVPHNWQSGSFDLAEAWLEVGNTLKGEEIAEAMMTSCQQYLDWYLSLSTPRLLNNSRDCLYYLYQMDEITRLLDTYKSQKATAYQESLRNYMTNLHLRGVSFH